MNLKQNVLFGIFFIVLFHGAWYALSRAITHRLPPDEQAISIFHRNYPGLVKPEKASGIVEHTFIKANGHKLHMSIMARGKNRLTLVFIPGSSVYVDIYMNFLEAMYDSGFNVVAFDPRGHGRSSGLRGDYCINEIVDDALSVCDYARKRFQGKIVISGSSQGGILAFYTAARDDRLDGALCHNLADLNGHDNLKLLQFKIPSFIVPISTGIMNLYRKFVIPVSLYLNLKIEYFSDGTSIDSFLRESPLANSWITLRALNSLVETPLSKPVEKITVPVMLIHSENDSIFPKAYVEGIFDRLNCPKRYLLVKDSGHMVLSNNVAAVSPAVTQWLQNL